MDFLENIKPLTKDELDDYIIFLCGGGAGGKLQGGYAAALAQMGVINNALMLGGTSAGGLNTGIFSVFGGLAPRDPAEDLPDVEPLPPELEPDLSNIDIPEPYADGVAIWENIKTNKQVYQGTFTSLWDKIGAGFGFMFGKDSILGPKPFYDLMDKTFGDITLKEAADMGGTEISLTATDLNTMKAVFFTSFNPATQNHKLTTIMKATSAIPGIFPSVPIKMPNGETHWFVDGGTVANNPFVAYTNFNSMFPEKQVKKAIILYCYPDAFVDDGLYAARPKNSKSKYKAYRDALLRTIPSILNGQEQIAEMFIEDKVNFENWDVVAFFPQEPPCDALDFSVPRLEQQGYDQVATGKVYSYKEDAEINILDFLRKNDG